MRPRVPASSRRGCRTAPIGRAWRKPSMRLSREAVHRREVDLEARRGRVASQAFVSLEMSAMILKTASRRVRRLAGVEQLEDSMNSGSIRFLDRRVALPVTRSNSASRAYVSSVPCTRELRVTVGTSRARRQMRGGRDDHLKALGFSSSEINAALVVEAPLFAGSLLSASTLRSTPPAPPPVFALKSGSHHSSW